jgi:hypothetical protein
VHGCFDPMAHSGRVTRVRARIDARAFLRLRRQGLQAGLVESDGHVVPPETGAPHGGSRSPVLAQGYVHAALEVATAGMRVRAPLCIADASTTEEPDAGKLHVRDCTGGAG